MKSGSAGEKKQDEKIESKGGQEKEKGKYKLYGLGGRAERSRAESLGSRHWGEQGRAEHGSQEAAAGRAGDAKPIEAGTHQAHGGGQQSSGLDNNKASPCRFSTAAQTNHYTPLQPRPVGVRCPQIPGKRPGKLRGHGHP